jgi:hypothetical protein
MTQDEVGRDDLSRLKIELDTLEFEIVKLKETLKEATQAFDHDVFYNRTFGH